MRFRLPDDCTGVVIDGAALLRDADGMIEADADATDALAVHDIRPIDEGEPALPSAARRGHRGRTDDRRMLR